MSATLLANIPAAWPKLFDTGEATGLPEDNARPVNDPPNPPTEPEQRFAKTMAGLRRVIDAGSGSAMLTHEDIYDEVCRRADAGSTFALNQLAKILEDAHTSADAGDASAQIFLAKIHIKAAIWRFHEAVLRTDTEALFKLARLLGEFSSEDAEGQRWYNTDAANKHPEAREYQAKKEIELSKKKAQNDGVNQLVIPPLPPVTSEIILKDTHIFLAGQKIPEPDCPEVAAPIAQIIEQYHRDPEALKTMLPAVTNILTTGAAMPEAGHAQRVTRSRSASATQQEPPAPVYPDIPPPPIEAPAKYAERTEIDPKTGRLEGVDKFFPRTYAPWIIPDPEGGTRPLLTLPRKLIEQLDEDCDRAISQWISNHKGEDFPIKIGRKNGVDPVSAEEASAARSKANWADYQKRRQTRQGGLATGRSQQ